MSLFVFTRKLKLLRLKLQQQQQPTLNEIGGIKRASKLTFCNNQIYKSKRIKQIFFNQ